MDLALPDQLGGPILIATIFLLIGVLPDRRAPVTLAQEKLQFQ